MKHLGMYNYSPKTYVLFGVGLGFLLATLALSLFYNLYLSRQFVTVEEVREEIAVRTATSTPTDKRLLTVEEANRAFNEVGSVFTQSGILVIENGQLKVRKLITKPPVPAVKNEEHGAGSTNN